MKKIFMLGVVIILGFGLNACGGNDNYNSDRDSNNDDGLTTLFLVDENAYSYAGVPYICDSMESWSQTADNGEFTFIQPDTCVFDFYGLDGVYDDNFDDVVRIVDYNNNGKGAIDYDCSSFGVGSTYSDGSFEYDENDECTFYL